MSRSRYVRGALVLAAAATDAEVLAAVESLPPPRRETWTRPLGRVDREEEIASG